MKNQQQPDHLRIPARYRLHGDRIATDILTLDNKRARAHAFKSTMKGIVRVVAALQRRARRTASAASSAISPSSEHQH